MGLLRRFGFAATDNARVAVRQSCTIFWLWATEDISMILSFDLDDMLFAPPAEPDLPPFRSHGDRLRLGSVAFFCELRNRGP